MPEPTLTRRPPWLKMPFPDGDGYRELKVLVQNLKLHTVCESARCPNIGECWNQRTATFMILGDVCTRACGFCNIATGRPDELDELEPWRVAHAVHQLGLHYAVLTSVNRDELRNGGAHIFANTLRAIHELAPDCRVEVLIPDFKGDADALYQVLDADPAVLNHNIETVPRLFRQVHAQADYERTLALFRRSHDYRPDIPVKTGFMVGHGETFDECVALMRDCFAAGVRALTIGQYLRPSPSHLRVERYWPPEAFAELKQAGLSLGLAHVEAGPFVRSSYHAAEQEAAASGVAVERPAERVMAPNVEPSSPLEAGRRRGLALRTAHPA